jgi:WD40 repeat protein
LLALLGLLVLVAVIAGIWRSGRSLSTARVSRQEPIPWPRLDTRADTRAIIRHPDQRPANPPSVRILSGNKAPVGPVVVSADGKRALSGAWDGKVLVWDLDSGTAAQSFGDHVGWAWAVAISGDGREALTAGKTDRTVRLWTADGKKKLLDRSGLPGTPVGVGFTPTGPMALLAAGEGQWRLLLWDVRRDKKVGVFEGHTDRIHRAIISSDGRRILSAGVDRTARLWNVDSGKPVHCFQGHTGAVLAIDLARDGSKVVTGGEDGRVRLWDIDTGNLLQLFDGRQGKVECVAFDAAGQQILSGGHDGTVCWWTDLRRPDRCLRLTGHTDLVGGVAFVPEIPTRQGLSGSADHSVRLWTLPK